MVMNSLSSTELAGLQRLRGLIVDMDGVLWHGDVPLPGLQAFFKVLRQRSIKFVLATNNNTKLPQGFVEKVSSMGVEIMPEEVITASIATVHYLNLTYPPGSRIYVVGEKPLKELITSAGFILADSDVVAVVATMDRQLTYDMLKEQRCSSVRVRISLVPIRMQVTQLRKGLYPVRERF